MKLNKTTSYLFLAGITLLLVGSFISVSPSNYLLQFSVVLDGKRNDFFSEIRGMGGGLLVFGLYIITSIVQERNQDIALTLSSLLFSAFVVFRVVSLLVDGMPGQGIFIALLLEMILALSAISLVLTKKSST